MLCGMSDASIVQSPVCPRCRYDLRGATASWSESCRCTGRCPECGFDFDWADLLRPDRQRDERFIEHTRRRRRIPRAAIRTLARSFYPPGFWSWIKLHHETSVRRMILWVLLLIVPLWAAQALCVNVGLFVVECSWLSLMGSSDFSHYTTYLSAWTQPIIAWGDFSRGLHDYEWLVAESIPAILMSLMALQIGWPLMVAVLPTTLGKAKVHWKHILRAFIYSTGWTVLSLLAVVTIRVVDLYEVLASPNTTWGHSPTIIERLNGNSLFFILTFGFMLWTLWWWYIVIVRHWRLQRGHIVWMVLLIPVSLIAFAAATLHQIWQVS